MGHPEGVWMDLRWTTSRIEVVFVFMAAAISLSTLVCSAFLVRPVFRARYLFRELETLSLRHATFEDAQRLAKRIDAKPTDFSCTRSSCEWAVRMDNSAIPRWWRGSGETFGVSFAVENSIVVRKGAGYGTGLERDVFRSAVALEEEEHWDRKRIQEPLTAGWLSSNMNRYDEFVVYMTPKASAEDRRRYTSYNFSCFSKYRGCRDGRQLLSVAGSFPAMALD